MKVSKSKVLECAKGYPYLFVTPKFLEFYAYSEEKRITRVKIPFETGNQSFRGCAFLDERVIDLISKIPVNEIEVVAEWDEEHEMNVVFFDEICIELANTAYAGELGK